MGSIIQGVRLQILSSAAVNMRENTGDGVPEPTLKVLVTKMLEEVENVVCGCVYACVCACVWMCVCTWACVWMCVCVCVVI